VTRAVRDLMSADAATLREDDQLIVADQVMQLGRIRHLPVVDAHGVLVGLVSQRDLYRSALLRSLEEDGSTHQRRLQRIGVRDVMSHPVRTTTPDTPLSEAAGEMIDHKVGCLPVVEGGRLVGILTEADFVRTFRD
jgi:CBS domain-containing membrane protein